MHFKNLEFLMFFYILFNLTSTPLSLENCAWISHEAILTTEALHKKEAVALIPLPDVPSLGKANFHKAAPYYSLHSQPRILLFFLVKPTANNAKTAACFNVPFHFLTSICHIFFHPLKLTETCFFLSCACASPCTQNSAVQLRLPDATKLQAVLITSHPAISFWMWNMYKFPFRMQCELQFCHR